MTINGSTSTLCGATSDAQDDHSSQYCRAIVTGLGAGAITIQPQLRQSTSNWMCIGAFTSPVVTVEEIY